MSMVLRSTESCILHTINVLIVFLEAVRLRYSILQIGTRGTMRLNSGISITLSVRTWIFYFNIQIMALGGSCCTARVQISLRDLLYQGMSNLQFLAVWSGFVSSDLVKTRQRGMEPQGHRLLGIVSETHFFFCVLSATLSWMPLQETQQEPCSSWLRWVDDAGTWLDYCPSSDRILGKCMCRWG